MFVTIQRENISPSKKEMNNAVTMLKLPDVYSLAMNHYVFLSLANRKSSVHLHALYSSHCTKDVYTPQGSTCDLRTVEWVEFTSTLTIRIHGLAATPLPCYLL
jgi:hypothetical protein